MSNCIHKIEVSIVVPTYNERENIRMLCDGLTRALDGLWGYELIFVDDNSPDGTASAVRQLAEGDSRVILLERPGKLGLGSAVVDGGNPVGESSTVQSNGTVVDNGGANPASGYSLIEAPDLDEAIAKAKGCPVLTLGGSIEVAEAFDM